MPEFDYGSVTVQYEDLGSGRGLAMLHSGGASSRQWRKAAKLLAAHRRIIAPDFYGFGNTGSWQGASPLSHNDQAELAVAVIERTECHPVDIVGHSYGGAIAIRIALRYPQLVAKLVLIEPILPTLLQSVEPTLFEEYRQVAEGFINHVVDDRPSEAWALFLDYRNGAGTWARLSDAAKERFFSQTAQAAEGFRSNLTSPTTLEDIGTLRQPTLVLCGSETTRPDEVVTHLVNDALPNATYGLIDGAGHMSPLTHPEAVAALVATHLAIPGF